MYKKLITATLERKTALYHAILSKFYGLYIRFIFYIFQVL